MSTFQVLILTLLLLFVAYIIKAQTDDRTDLEDRFPGLFKTPDEISELNTRGGPVILNACCKTTTRFEQFEFLQDIQDETVEVISVGNKVQVFQVDKCKTATEDCSTCGCECLLTDRVEYALVKATNSNSKSRIGFRLVYISKSICRCINKPRSDLANGTEVNQCKNTATKGMVTYLAFSIIILLQFLK